LHIEPMPLGNRLCSFKGALARTCVEEADRMARQALSQCLSIGATASAQ
jgi:hypothetical protein